MAGLQAGPCLNQQGDKVCSARLCGHMQHGQARPLGLAGSGRNVSAAPQEQAYNRLGALGHGVHQRRHAIRVAGINVWGAGGGIWV